MKILLAALAVCTLFSGCLPPPGSIAVVTPGYHRPYGYGYGSPYGYGNPYRYGSNGYGSPYGYRHDGYRSDAYRSEAYRHGQNRPYAARGTVVVPTRHTPNVRNAVVARPPFPGARWVNGHWIR